MMHVVIRHTAHDSASYCSHATRSHDDHVGMFFLRRLNDSLARIGVMDNKNVACYLSIIQSIMCVYYNN